MNRLDLHSGELDQRIRIRLWSDVPNAGFGLDPTFDVGIERWAKHEAIHGLALRAGMQTGETATDLFWVRSGAGTQAHDFSVSHVVEWKGRRYRIMDVIATGSKRQFTRLTVKDLEAL